MQILPPPQTFGAAIVAYNHDHSELSSETRQKIKDSICKGHIPNIAKPENPDILETWVGKFFTGLPRELQKLLPNEQYSIFCTDQDRDPLLNSSLGYQSTPETILIVHQKTDIERIEQDPDDERIVNYYC